MPLSNRPTGYHGFKLAIEEATASLGGPWARKAVANLFTGQLYREIQTTTGAYYHQWGDAWTQATDADFDRATIVCTEYLSRSRPEPTLEAEWQGVHLRIRGNDAYLEGGGQALLVAMAGGQGEQWMIHITDYGEKILTETKHYLSNSPKSTHARSQEAALKSLRRIVQTFFKVELSPPASSPDDTPASPLP